MTHRRSVTAQTQRHCDSTQSNGRLKDEVYRQMYRLESHRPGAALDLALALLRAWTAMDAPGSRTAERHWLQQICPICIRMLESA